MQDWGCGSDRIVGGSRPCRPRGEFACCVTEVTVAIGFFDHSVRQYSLDQAALTPHARGHGCDGRIRSMQENQSANQEAAMKSVLCLATLSLLLCAPALAHQVETDTIMVCDTQKQAERYVQLFDGNSELAISAVNAEANDPTACAMVNVAYVPGPPLGMARSRSHGFELVPIAVIAVKTPVGFQRVKPAIAYTLVKIREHAV